LAAGTAESRAGVITDYTTLSAAVGLGAVSTFGANVTVSLTNAPDGLEVASDLVLDGLNNAPTITRSDAGRMFHVLPNVSLTLKNVVISGGTSSNGGAIFNEGR